MSVLLCVALSAFRFAFSYREAAAPAMDGYYLYDPLHEYTRQGALRTGQYALSTLNVSYEFSPTYPAVLCLPAALDVEEVNKIKAFRSKGRIPTLCFYHRANGAVILRSAQPLAGVVGWRCHEDEKLLRCSRVNYILDARPKANAVGNQAMGGGYENADNYTDCQLEFMNIENIHVMRESLNKLYSLLWQASALPATGKEDWATELDNTQWMKHVRLVLLAAVRTARLVYLEGKSVLIHCSDGWDRTAQMTSLSQLLLVRQSVVFS
jgi:myotubularin-related protein 1/2